MGTLRLLLLFAFSLTIVDCHNIIGINSKSLKKGDAEPPAKRPIRLFAMRFCPWCERVIIYLSRKNISAEIVNVNLLNKPDFLYEKNVLGKVPVLQHGQKLVLDSAAICEYLDVVMPETSILPFNNEERERHKTIAEQVQQIITPALGGIVEAQRNPKLKELKHLKLKHALKKLEKRLTTAFFAGPTPGFADYMTYPFMERIFIWTHTKDGTDLDLTAFPGREYPRLGHWFHQMYTLPEITAIAQPLENHQLFNEGSLLGNPNYDAGAF